MATSYIDLLKDPRWQRKRLEILERDGWTCMGCADTTKTLHVHHKRYRSGHKPWESTGDDVVTLCETCHAATTKTRKLLNAALDELADHQWDDQVVLGFVEALVATHDLSRSVCISDAMYAVGVAALIGAAVSSKTNDGFALYERAQKTGGMVNPMQIIEEERKRKT